MKLPGNPIKTLPGCSIEPIVINRTPIICVMGCLMTELGQSIKTEMIDQFSQNFDIIAVNQEPPGKFYEFPALSFALNLSIKSRKPILYVHTKGAYNKVPVNYKTSMMAPSVKLPPNVVPEDCQRVVRRMWYKEFIGSFDWYYNMVDVKHPMVACPLTGKEKITWQNGFMFNPSCAVELQKSFHLDEKRHYYEMMFSRTNISVIGRLANDIHLHQPTTPMWNIIWSYF